MQCSDCGSDRPVLQFHHIIPKSQGGDDSPENRIGICRNCHEDRHTGPNADSLPWQLGHTPAAKAKRAATMKRLWADPEYRAKTLAARAAKRTPEAQQRRTASVRKWYADPANRQSVAEAATARNKTPEHRERLRELHREGKLKPPPPGTPEGMAHARSFRKPPTEYPAQSPESNAKRSEAMKRRWAEGAFTERQQHPEKMAEAIRRAWDDGKYANREFRPHEGQCTCCGETEPAFLFARRKGVQHCRNCWKATLGGATCPHQIAK